MKLQLPLVDMVQEFIKAGAHHTPQKDCRSTGFSNNHVSGSLTHIVAVSSAASYGDGSNSPSNPVPGRLLPQRAERRRREFSAGYPPQCTYARGISLNR